MPAAMAWPPPLSSKPSVTARRTVRPRSTPWIERPEPVPMPPGSSAMAKAGRLKRSFSRAASRPTTPGCQLAAAVTTTAPFSSMPSAAIASASASASIACSSACRSRLSRSSSAAIRPASTGSSVREQQRAEIGAADAAAGVDARTEQEAEMPRLRRAGEPRHVHQRGQADIGRGARSAISPLATKARLRPVQRHHVGDGAERHDIERAEQIGLGPRVGPEAARAQHAIDRDDGDEHQTDGGEMAEPGEIVEPVRIDDQRVRQLLVGLMMVDARRRRARACAPRPAARCWWCRNRR